LKFPVYLLLVKFIYELTLLLVQFLGIAILRIIWRNRSRSWRSCSYITFLTSTMQIEIHFLRLVIWMIIQFEICSNSLSKLVITRRQFWELKIINFYKGVVSNI